MANKTRSKTAEGYAAAYKTTRRWETNRRIKLERVLKEQPNNSQVKDALKSIVYRRKTPNKQEWSASWIRVAKLFKEFTGKFDKNIMSAKPEVAQAAINSCRLTQEYTPVVGRDKNMFSLFCRVNINSGAAWTS